MLQHSAARFEAVEFGQSAVYAGAKPGRDLSLACQQVVIQGMELI